jgi:hypothetical protein
MTVRASTVEDRALQPGPLGRPATADEAAAADAADPASMSRRSFLRPLTAVLMLVIGLPYMLGRPHHVNPAGGTS